MNFRHYHGDTVRKLFLAGGAVMLVSLPFLHQFIPYPALVSIFSILFIGFFAGIVAPAQKWVIALNTLIAGGAFAVFEYYTVQAYVDSNRAFLAVNQILAVIFFVAFYYSTKTIRGHFVKQRPTDYHEMNELDRRRRELE